MSHSQKLTSRPLAVLRLAKVDLAALSRLSLYGTSMNPCSDSVPSLAEVLRRKGFKMLRPVLSPGFVSSAARPRVYVLHKT